MKPSSSHRIRRGPALLIVVWILTALACSLPTQARLRARQAATEAAIQQAVLATVQAMTTQLAATPQAQGTLLPTQPPGVDPSTPVPPPAAVPDGLLYTVQPGDTLGALARRFGVEKHQIQAEHPLPERGFLPVGLQLVIPDSLDPAPYLVPLLPDSEVVYSPTAAGFDIQAFVQQAGGYLNSYQEQVDGITLSGVQIVQRAAVENSINPRLLLALLEYRSHWVYGLPGEITPTDYPIGFQMSEYRGLSKELSLAVRQLNLGYYGWRDGSLTELTFGDGGSARIAPGLNAGTVAVQYLFSRLLYESSWQQALYGERSFAALYAQMFGDPWAAAAAMGPLLPDGLAQPELALPFTVGERWAFTGGPHLAWGVGTPLASLDFAPITGESRCAVSRAWVHAAAPGVITRADRGVVALDLDGDGWEQTGWVLVYMHVSEQERIPAGSVVNFDDPIGHPSCEGGSATGTHVHLARKYNGEWLAADGPLPFELGGWLAVAGERPYRGYLVRGGRLISASVNGESNSVIIRD